ncbi:MAG: glucose-1-phosphate adenylyltransferase [Candidatus Hydrogenedentes bacterium]|nr:glucose-1-phosphate adenylyltransferase [Candidatus Hydrogenedentota bacterium]
MQQTLTILLAGGAGERLYPLTRDRAKPAVPFGGIYRIIDFTLSNCVNSGCRKILVLTQYKSNSLARHINRGWNFLHPELGEFIEIIPPQMRINSNWYLGTADAIYQNFYSINQHDPGEVLLLSGDHIYKMNYQKMAQRHREAGADLTVAAIEVPLEEARRFGVFEVNAAGQATGFEEKPDRPKPLPESPGTALASMGVYLFDAGALQRVVSEDAERTDSHHDFGRDIIPRMLKTHKVFTFRFEDENRKHAKYWRDVGTLDSYWEANMDLVAVDPLFNLYDRDWPMRTDMPMLPPAKFVFAEMGNRFGVAVDSIVSPGCIISGGLVDRCVLSSGVRVNSYAHVQESILMDRCVVGRHCRLRRVIVEKEVHIPENTLIGYDLARDAARFRVTPSGVVIVESSDRFGN